MILISAAVLCWLPAQLVANEDPFKGPSIEVDLIDTSEEDAKAWKEWADALAAAKEIQLICLLGPSKDQVIKLADPERLEAIAKEVSADLEASEVTETEWHIEVRIPGFKPKHSSVLWVAYAGYEPVHRYEIFMIGSQHEGSTFSSTSVGAKEGKTIPALTKLVREMEAKWGFKRHSPKS